MKKLISLILVFTFLGINLLWAESTVTVSVSATVQPQLSLTYWIRKVPANVSNPYGTGTSDASSIAFGTLNYVNGIYVSDYYYTVFLIANTSGRPYKIQQSCSGISNIAGKSINKSLIMTPDYQANDKFTWPGGEAPQGTMPSTDSLGAKTLAVGDNKLIYQGNSGLSRIIRCYYGLATGATGEPADSEPIKGDQASGDYTGSITFTVTLL